MHPMIGSGFKRKKSDVSGGVFRMVFDDINNAPVSDPSSVSDWNDFFIISAISNVQVIGDEVICECDPGQNHPSGSSTWQNDSSILEFIDTNVFTTYGSNAFEGSSLVYFESQVLEVISEQMFRSCSDLIEAKALSVIEIEGSLTFFETSSLQRAIYPLCEIINNDCFRVGSAIGATTSTPLEIDFSSLQIASGSSHFLGRRGLQEVVDFPELLTIPSNFLRNTRITHCNAPKATSIGSNAFRSVTTIVQCNAPLVESIGANAFEDTGALAFCDFPNCETVGNRAFTAISNTSAMTVINLPLCKNINGWTTWNRRRGVHTINLNSVETIGSNTGDNNVFNRITGNNIELTIPDTDVRNDGDIIYLDNNNNVTFIDP